jgi:ADP-dependent NAD(P)H-hydrate dehydratase
MDVTTLPQWPPRPLDSNKGTFGRVLIVAGSRGMAGAAALAGRACLRGGVGLVRVACPESVQSTIAAFEPCLMTLGLPEDAAGQFADAALPAWRDLAAASDVVALGPGLGRSVALDALVPQFIRECPRPMVVDADALNAMAGKGDAWSQRSSPAIVTPHPGELGRMMNQTTAEIQAGRRAAALQCAREAKLVVVLKGHGTIVTDGDRIFVNTTGNPGMATAGAGDVLTGLIAALLAQGFAPFEAAQLGAHLHGRAGDLACATIGEVSLIATDLIDYLPKAIREVYAPSV